MTRSWPGVDEPKRVPDLGDLVVMLLASTLAGLSEHLAADGFADSAELVADLVDVVDGYLVRVAS